MSSILAVRAAVSRARAHHLGRVRLVRGARLGDVGGCCSVQRGEYRAELIGSHAPELAECALWLRLGDVRRLLVWLGGRSTGDVWSRCRRILGRNHRRRLLDTGLDSIIGRVVFRRLAGRWVLFVRCALGDARVRCARDFIARRFSCGRMAELVDLVVVLVVLAERVGRCRLRAQRDARRLASHRPGCCPRRFALELLPGPCALSVLLRDVRELMGEHELAAGRCQVDSAPLEMDVTPARERRLPGPNLGAVAMEVHVIEPTAVRALHPALQRCRQPFGWAWFVAASIRLRLAIRPRYLLADRGAPFCGTRPPALPRPATGAHVGQLRQKLLGRTFERSELRFQALVMLETVGEVATCRCEVLLQRADRDSRRVVVARGDHALELGARRVAAVDVALEERSRLVERGDLRGRMVRDQRRATRNPMERDARMSRCLSRDPRGPSRHALRERVVLR
jgi:hypothetical protein